MEVIPEHLTLPVMAMEATAEQRASPVVPTETNPVCHVMLSETILVSVTEALHEHLRALLGPTEAILDVISSRGVAFIDMDRYPIQCMTIRCIDATRKI